MQRNAFLGAPLTAAYRPAVVGTNPFYRLNGPVRLFTLHDVEQMREDPKVNLGLRILKGPISTATWEVEGDAETAQIVDATLKRFWSTSLDHALLLLDYGNAAGEPLYREEDGFVVFDRLKEHYVHDVQPLQLRGEFWGTEVRNAGAQSGAVRLTSPRTFWVACEPEFGSLYGRSRLRGAWSPWLEKRDRHGATDIRRLWYLKNSFRGGVIRHPPGVTTRDDGVVMSNQDLAREILEKFEAGGILVLPNAKDLESGEYLWSYDPPAPNGDVPGVREYVGDLDFEILEGLGVPREVAQATGDTGSGFAGRSIPATVFYVSEDRIVKAIIDAVVRQISRPLVEINFGPGRRFEVKPKSLVPLQQGQQPEEGDEGQRPQRPGPPRPTPPGRLSLRLSDWESYQGTQGGRGWRNAQTGEVRYQSEKPADDGAGDKPHQSLRRRQAERRELVQARWAARRWNDQRDELLEQLDDIDFIDVPHPSASRLTTLIMQARRATQERLPPAVLSKAWQGAADEAVRWLGKHAVTLPEDPSEHGEHRTGVQAVRQLGAASLKLVRFTGTFEPGELPAKVQRQLRHVEARELARAARKRNRLSLDRAATESADAIVDQLIEQGAGANYVIAEEIRQRLHEAVKKKSRPMS